MNAQPVGLVHGFHLPLYLAAPGLGSSALSALARSPWHYWAEYLAPDRPERPATPAMLAGTLAHCAILEPDELPRRYAFLPEDAPRRPTSMQMNAKKPSPDTVAAIDWWRDFNAEHSGAEIITREQLDTAKAQRLAVLAVPELAALLADGRPEESVFAADPATGVACKARPDYVHPLADGRVILLDVKSTTDPAPDEFARSVWRYGYHRQAAHYTATYQAATGIEVAAFVFAAVSNAYPFLAVPIMLDDEAAALGARQRRLLLATFAECTATGAWPRPSEGMQVLSLPTWAIQESNR